MNRTGFPFHSVRGVDVAGLAELLHDPCPGGRHRFLGHVPGNSGQIRVWHSRALLKAAAVAALSELVVPMIVALIIDTGDHPWRVAVFVGGVLGIGVLVGYWVLYGIAGRKAIFDWIQARIRVFSLLIYGLILISPFSGGLALLAIMCIWLLLSGCIEAFWLLGAKDDALEPKAQDVTLRSVVHALRKGIQHLRE
jgi:hypothetical protein